MAKQTAKHHNLYPLDLSDVPKQEHEGILELMKDDGWQVVESDKEHGLYVMKKLWSKNRIMRTDMISKEKEVLWMEDPYMVKKKFKSLKDAIAKTFDKVVGAPEVQGEIDDTIDVLGNKLDDLLKGSKQSKK